MNKNKTSPKSKVTDMTKGPIASQILAFSLPLVAGNLFQQLYNTVDSVVVGHYVGKEALAAIGAITPISMTIIGFFMGLASGASVVVSQYFGAKEFNKLKNCIHTMILGTVICGIVLTFSGVFLTPLILHLMSTPDDVFAQAKTYLQIYFAGILSVMLYNVCSGVLRALGDSKRPLYFLILTSFVNIVLDLLFVIYFKLGIAGVAYATVISQTIAASLVFLMMLKTKECYRVELKKLRIYKDALIKVLKQGFPGALQVSITAFSNLFVIGYFNAFGSACLAGWSSFNRIDQVSLLPIQSIAIGATTFVGQNHGANKNNRAKKGINVSVFLAFVFVAFLICAFEIFPEGLISIFSKDEQVLKYGSFFLRTGAPFYLFRLLNQVYAGALRGFGNASAPMFIFLFSFVLFRQAYLFVITRIFPSDFIPVAFAYPSGWCICGILMFLYYIRKPIKT